MKNHSPKFLRLIIFCPLLILYIFWQIERVQFDPFKEVTIYSNHCDDFLCPLISKTLQSAKKSILLIVYTFHEESLELILEKQSKKGVQITLIQDPKLGKPLTNIETLFKPTQGLMHQKIAVIDEEKVLLGSANFTKESLHLDDNILITLKSKDLALALSKMEPLHFTIDSQWFQFYPLPKAKEEAFERVLQTLNCAKKSIKVAMFTWTHPQLTDAIIQAHKRGVQVEVVIDRRSGEGASLESVKTLKNAKVPLSLSQGAQTFHHKFAIVDDEIFLMGSTNWTKAAFSKNDESLLIIENLNEKQRKKLQKIWHAIQSESMKKVIVKKRVVDLRSEPQEIDQKEKRLTQLLYNEKGLCSDTHHDWLYVQALEQEHFTDNWHPYTGWLHVSEVQFVDHFLKPHFVVVSCDHPFYSFGTYLHNHEGIDPCDIRSLKTPFCRKTMVKDCEKFLGKPYLWGGRESAHVDCSGLINLLYRAQGIDIPRDAHPQLLKSKKIEKKELLPGDLIYMTKVDSTRASHVLFYKDKNTFLEAPSTGKQVQALSFATHYLENEGILQLVGRENRYTVNYGRFLES